MIVITSLHGGRGWCDISKIYPVKLSGPLGTLYSSHLCVLFICNVCLVGYRVSHS